MDTPGPPPRVELRAVRLLDFRNHERTDVELPAGLTLVVGPNGAGKTNLLEALALVLLGASPRTSSEVRCVREGARSAHVSATADLDGWQHRRGVTIDRVQGKRLDRDGTAVRGVDAFAADAPAVVFLPERLLVVRGAPARRRATLDRLVTRTDPPAGTALRDYVSALGSRNAVLRAGKGRALDERSLAVWTDQVVAHGEEVRRRRRRTLDLLDEPFRRRFEELTGFPAGALRLEPRGDDIAAALAENRTLDLRRATTSAGPHLDELVFLEGERDLRSFGSTGEQRAALLAWALAEADVTAAERGVQPVLLLDEPYAELDPARRARLTAALLTFGQVVVTSTERPHGDADATDATVLTVSSGAIRPCPSAAAAEPTPST